MKDESNPDLKWEKLLEDYNTYLKEYIAHYKKALKGNSISKKKYLELKTQFESTYLVLEKGLQAGQLTAIQQKKIVQIQTKLLYAIQR
jgi:hypothetical protein